MEGTDSKLLDAKAMAKPWENDLQMGLSEIDHYNWLMILVNDHYGYLS